MGRRHWGILGTLRLFPAFLFVIYQRGTAWNVWFYGLQRRNLYAKTFLLAGKRGAWLRPPCRPPLRNIFRQSDEGENWDGWGFTWRLFRMRDHLAAGRVVCADVCCLVMQDLERQIQPARLTLPRTGVDLS